MSSKRSSSTPSSSAAAEIIEGNDDLLIEILILFPAKSLVRFKVVSKRWRSFISAPLFSRRHTVLHQRGRETQPAFILGSYGSKYFVCNPITRKLSPFPLSFPVVQIVQSCNGLLLLRCRQTKEGRIPYYVFNPTTMQQRELTSPINSDYVRGIQLIFDSSLSPYYRVVCFYFENYTHANMKVFLYDSESHKSKRGGNVFDNMLWLDAHKGVNFNGAIYFYRYFCDNSSARFIPEGNVSEIIPNPPSHHSDRRKKDYVMESNGFLLSLSLSWENGSNLLHMSEMKGIESGWSNKYRADINPILGKGDKCVDDMNLLGVIRGERDQDSLLLLLLNGKIMFYRFWDGVCEHVVDCTSEEFREENPLWCVDEAHHFIHSLAPV